MALSQTDKKTKKAWEKNWENITIPEILRIFEYERVKEQMAIMTRVLPKNDRILEGGCGLAPYLIRLRQLGFDVAGIDYNDGPIRKVLEYDAGLPVRSGDVTAIPFADGTFGGYLSLGVIEHFTEGPEKAIREAYRVLKPGGVFYVAVPRNHLWMRLTAPMRWIKGLSFLRKLLNRPDDHHYWEQYFKKDALAKTLQSLGFEVAEIHALDHAHALASAFSIFRDKKTYDEVSPLGLTIGRWCRKHLTWITAAQMAYVCYKRVDV